MKETKFPKSSLHGMTVVERSFVYGDQPKRDEGNGVSEIELAWHDSCRAEFFGVMYTAISRRNSIKNF